MKYKGIELVEETKEQIFDKPQKMVVWDNDEGNAGVVKVLAIISHREFPVITEISSWKHGAKIPEIPEVLATHRELAKWLAQGNGEMRSGNLTMTFTNLAYDFSMADDPIGDHAIVRKWDDTGWHSPTREYLGLEEM